MSNLANNLSSTHSTTSSEYQQLMEKRIREGKRFSQAMGKQCSARTDHWSIPAAEALDGTNTCPGKGLCAEWGGCYALNGRYRMTNVILAHHANLMLSKDVRFIDVMVDEIGRRRNLEAYRIHTAGDFYSLLYYMDWVAIARNLPDVQFYAYTKMVPMFRQLLRRTPHMVPPNLTLIYSEGGRWDHLIDTRRDRHSRVFSSAEELHAAGYVNATEDDTIAWRSTNHRIGLVYHGAASKQWSTNNND